MPYLSDQGCLALWNEGELLYARIGPEGYIYATIKPVGRDVRTGTDQGNEQGPAGVEGVFFNGWSEEEPSQERHDPTLDRFRHHLKGPC